MYNLIEALYIKAIMFFKLLADFLNYHEQNDEENKKIYFILTFIHIFISL